MRRIKILGRRKVHLFRRYTVTQEFQRFFISGIISQIVYYSVYIGATEKFDTHYLVSAALAFIFYWLVNFHLIKYWTFQSKAKARHEAWRYFLLHAGNQLLGFVGLYILIEWMGLHYVAAQLLMTGVYFCINLFFSRKIFNESVST